MKPKYDAREDSPPLSRRRGYRLLNEEEPWVGKNLPMHGAEEPANLQDLCMHSHSEGSMLVQ